MMPTDDHIWLAQVSMTFWESLETPVKWWRSFNNAVLPDDYMSFPQIFFKISPKNGILVQLKAAYYITDCIQRKLKKKPSNEYLFITL